MNLVVGGLDREHLTIEARVPGHGLIIAEDDPKRAGGGAPSLAGAAAMARAMAELPRRLQRRVLALLTDVLDETG